MTHPVHGLGTMGRREGMKRHNQFSIFYTKVGTGAEDLMDEGSSFVFGAVSFMSSCLLDWSTTTRAK
ncbi:MAG: hypothetical protein GY847_19890 [Proteobacteria bacterium]|nr:hypothetical protein [Pseudomonadota bacterium]